MRWRSKAFFILYFLSNISTTMKRDGKNLKCARFCGLCFDYLAAAKPTFWSSAAAIKDVGSGG